MIIGSKNKGDWSEFYVLLYLLGTRELYAADEALERIATFCFPINKIIRNDKPTEQIDFVLDGIDTVNIYLNSELSRTMTSEQFQNEATALYHDILQGSGSFNIPHAEAFLNDIGLERLAAPPTDVTDIKMELHDTNTGIDQVMGFSVKSYLGGAPTLLNASGATNFSYEVIGISDEQMADINAIETRNKIIDRVQRILELGGEISFHHTVNEVFAGNMMMIDSRMEDIISEMLYYSYTTNELDCKSIIEEMEENNPLNFPRRGIYTHKFKQFLCAKALGMDPASEWSGEDDANGGYIVAKSNGEVLAYHLYNRDKFKQYLFDNTKFERASTSRHGFASLYKDGDKMFINFNMQIRFK